MIVTALCVAALVVGLVLCHFLAEPWFDVRKDVDWQKLGKDLGDGYSALRNEVDR